MPFSSGTFTRTFDCTTDRDNGVKILASKFDTELDGFATGLTTTILKDGSQTCTAAIPFAEGITLPDNKTITLGTNSDITIQYDETTNDSLEIAAAVEGAALGIVLKADQGDDNADHHKMTIADGGTLTLDSKISGSFVSYFTHTPHATVASSTTAIGGNLTAGGDVTITGDLTVTGDDITMSTNTAGHLLIADGTNFNPVSITSLSSISSVANDDVFLAVDTSGGGLKKIERSAIVAGLATSSAISNVVDDSTPQLGGSLDVNGQDIVSVSNGNITLTPNGTGVVRVDGTNGIDMESGAISIKNSGAESYVRFYCESSNAHYTQVQASPHSAYSGNVTVVLPASADTLVGKATTDTLTNKTIALGSNTVSGTFAQFNTAVTDATLVDLSSSQTLTNKSIAASQLTGALPAISGASLTALPATLPASSAANLTNIPAANITGTLPAIDGSNLTGITGGSNIKEKLAMLCDGQNYTVSSGTYTPTNVTAAQALTTSYATVTGSELSYTPPAGATCVVYDFSFQFSFYDAHAIGHFRFYIDSDEVTNARFNISGNPPESVSFFRYVIPIGGSANTATGRQATWTSAKTLKIQAREYSSANEAFLHSTNYWDGTSADQFHQPNLTIEALG